MRTRSMASVLLTLFFVAACSGGEPPSDGKPAAPTNVTATEAHGVVTVSWQHDGAEVDGFRVHRSPSSSQGSNQRASAQQVEQLGEVGSEARSFTDLSAEIGVDYSYSVTAFGTAGESPAASLPGAIAAEPGIAISMGTFVNPLLSVPRLTLALFEHLSAEELADATNVSVTVTGPAGWNNDDSVEFPVDMDVLIDGLQWFTISDAVVGTYEVDLAIDGGDTDYSHTFTLDDLTTLPLPTGLTLGAYDSTSVAASWDAHPSASSYVPQLFKGPHAAPTTVADGVTTSTSYEFTGLALEPGEYFFAVYVMPVDRTAQHRLVPPARFDVSLNATGLFTVE